MEGRREVGGGKSNRPHLKDEKYFDDLTMELNIHILNSSYEGTCANHPPAGTLALKAKNQNLPPCRPSTLPTYLCTEVPTYENPGVGS